MRSLPALALLAFCGCGGPQMPTLTGLFPLTGTLVQDGKPVAGGGLYFVAEEGGRSGCIFDASVNMDGTFEARTSRSVDAPVVFHPGMPIGKYKVIFHPRSDGSKTGLQIESDLHVSVEARRNNVEIVIPGKEKPKEEEN